MGIWTKTLTLGLGASALLAVPDGGGSVGSWRPTRVTGAPSARYFHTAVWTGSKMIIWGGYPGPGFTDTGAIYDPVSDVWAPTVTTDAPSKRELHTAVWTGSKMIVWGGGGNGFAYADTGGTYDPATDTWDPVSTTGAPTGRKYHTAVSTGSRMIVWGGESYTGRLDTGGIYDPATDTWAPVTTTGAPAARGFHSAVWTGSRMIVWGGHGEGQFGFMDSGGVYDPATDTWTPTSTVGAPSPRCCHTAVWTGSKMVVWGGGDASVDFDSGGIYDPVTDVWTPMSAVGAPTARHYHTSLWTGSKMIIWGGYDRTLLVGLDTGGQYDPATDAWTTTASVRAPAERYWQTGAWTGSRMIVWGGRRFGESFSSGGIYDPAGSASALPGDFDGDGNTDILWHNQATGYLYTWFLGGTGGVVTQSGSYLTPSRFADTHWQIRGIADFDGDGKSDILWHHQATGDLYVWFLGGTGGVVTQSGSYLAPSRFADTNWKIVEVADFDGDGKSDLLWHHQGNGSLYVWFLGGTNGVVTLNGSYLTPSSFSDTNWKVVPR